MSKLNVAVGGPQGVGKSTVLRLLACKNLGYEAISVGDWFPAGFRSLSTKDRAHVRAQASERLSSQLLANDEGILLVDLHYLDLREPDPRVQPSEVLAQFDMHVLLVAPADVLLTRRASDPNRTDRSLSIADAGHDVSAHVEYFGSETALGLNPLVIDCREGPLEVAEELRRHIDAQLQGSRPSP